MYDRMPRDYVTSNVLAWTTHAANVESASEEEGCDTDEPPDGRLPTSPITNHFKRTPIRRDSDQHHESLLTKAFQSPSEEESFHPAPTFANRRRRSITSNLSLASTTDLTCETGITTPARTSSPSPHLPDVGFVPLVAKANRIVSTVGSTSRLAQQPPAVEKKRCISFACISKPKSDDKASIPPSPKVQTSISSNPSTTEAPKKKSCIKFACNARPPKNTSPESVAVMATTPVPGKPSGMHKEASPKHRSPSTVRSFRATTPRRQGPCPAAAASKKYLDANFGDLQSEGSRFHEFASDEPQEDDWIRRDEAHSRRKLTIYDILAKENAIRKLGKEAEEEADMELEEELNDEADDDETPDGEEVDDEDEEGDDEDVDLDEDDLESGYGTDDDASDGYNTDNEVGFADSEDDDDDLVLWTTHQAGQLSISGPKPVVQRQNSLGGNSSDTSDFSKNGQTTTRGRRSKPIVFRPGTPELPDSTDFVCGTLDEDRPLEDAYISCMAARKREKQIPIPQDIDPSFPNSEPEDEIEELYKHGQGDSDDQIWLHGELEDIHHEQDRVGRRRKTGKESPRRLRSPPPKRPLSPAPKARGRSPRRLNGQTSPRRLRSPPPPRQGARSPVRSLVETTEGIAFKALAFGPGLTYTKSLPKAPAIFAHTKGRKRAGTAGGAGKANSAHVRGAIDIVKGLEQKRLRRKEKFYQKYCNNRARKEKAQERLPPGRGAEMMKEIGLGQTRVQGNYVISL